MLSHKSSVVSEEEVQTSMLELRGFVESATLSEEQREVRFALLQQLSEFELGRFLLVNRGLNGYWTDTIVNWPIDANANSKYQYANSLEEYLFESSPVFAARREAQQAIHQEVSPMLRPGSAMASIPCGLMSEVLLATQEPFVGVDLFAIDLDAENFSLIRERYGDRLVENTLHTMQMNAKELDVTESFDLICSIGLTIYMPNDDDVQELLNRFYSALKSNGGKLVTTFAASPEEHSPTLSTLPRTYALISMLINI